MRTCPACEQEISSLVLEGWLVFGSASLSVDSESEQIGPINAKVVFNEKGFLYTAMATCACGFRGKLSAFPAIYSCVLTGKRASHQVDFHETSYWVAEEAIPLMEALSGLVLFPSLSSYLGETNV
jgi:hypothetical protein